MKKNWIVQQKLTTSSRFSIDARISRVVDALLASRGITGQAKQRFLEPRFLRDLHDPFLMRGMKEVVARITQAVKKKERIGIFGDYDADGVCGSAILYSTFKRLGMDPLVETYLPDRQKEGFGLNESGIRYFGERGVSLIITNDCGITNHKEIAFARARGIEVIVTDHHELSQGPPPCLFLDPKRPDETYPFTDLAGTGVVFKLAQALRKSLKHRKLSEAWEKRLLDLVAIATVSDMMPLLDENRIFVKYGLMVLAQTHRKGLRALMQEAGLQVDALSARDLGFALGPRINATSRIDHASKALYLLLSEDDEEARLLARSIELLNKRRRSMVESILRRVRTRLRKQLREIQKTKLVFASDASWQPGILSLVSNRLKDDFLFPAIVVSLSDTLAIASCRSHAPFSLVEAMESIHKKYPSLFLRWGGHAQAAGFTVARKDLPQAKRAFEGITKRYSFERALVPIEIDVELQGPEVGLPLFEKVIALAPFGKGNPEPLFLLRGLRIAQVRKVGTQKNHIRIAFEKGETLLEGIFFNGSKDHPTLALGNTVDVVFSLILSQWNFTTKIELNVIDLDVV